MHGVQNIVFDLGNVIIDLHPDRTQMAFEALAPELGVNVIYSLKEQMSLIDQFEVGSISEETFYEQIRAVFGNNTADEDIRAAWNAMLGEISQENINLLKQLHTTHRCFALSNTNVLHLKAIDHYLQHRYGLDGLNLLFEKVYCSHEVGMRKPNRDIYEHLLQDAQLNPSETLFIDDRPENLQMADQLGMKTTQIQDPALLKDLFADFLA